MKTIIYGIIILAVVVCAFFYISFRFNSTSIEKNIASSKEESAVNSPINKEQKQWKVIPSSEPGNKDLELEAKLNDKNPYKVSEAIAILEEKGGKESIEQLEELFNSPTPSIIMDSVAALGRMQAKESVDNLENLYTNNITRVDGYGQSVRSEIIVALGNIKDEKAVDFLGTEFSRNESLPYKELLLDAHEKIGSKKSLLYLEEFKNFLEANPGPEDFPEIRFLVNEAKERTERIIEEIKSK